MKEQGYVKKGKLRVQQVWIVLLNYRRTEACYIVSDTLWFSFYYREVDIFAVWKILAYLYDEEKVYEHTGMAEVTILCMLCMLCIEAKVWGSFAHFHFVL